MRHTRNGHLIFISRFTMKTSSAPRIDFLNHFNYSKKQEKKEKPRNYILFRAGFKSDKHGKILAITLSEWIKGVHRLDSWKYQAL